MDTLLWPLKVAVAWVMVTIHKALVLIGFPDGPGIAWVLSIIGLTIVVRLLIMPLFVKQIRASRGMQLLQPELQALQAKYKGKKDPESRQRMNEEMMALYRKHGTNPLASCLPILVQMPVFFALFRVLASLGAGPTPQPQWPGATVVALDPGWVQTDMGGAAATFTVEQSVQGLVRTLAGVTPADRGRMLRHDGQRIAW